MWTTGLVTSERQPSVPAEGRHGDSNAITTRKGHQGSRAQETLATPDCSVQRPTAGGAKKKSFSDFFHYITNFYNIKYFSFQCTHIYFWL